MHDTHTLRMLGESITLRRNQWEELAALLVPTNPYDARDAAELAARIGDMLAKERRA